MDKKVNKRVIQRVNQRALKSRIYRVIFEHDTGAGKLFDVLLIIAVLLSVLAVMLETVQSLFSNYQKAFYSIEWFFTILFTIELIFRLYCSPNRWKYVASFYGMIDVIAIAPTYFSLFFPGAQAFLIIRAMRLLRVFRILKLNHYTNAGTQLSTAILASRPKIIVFLFFVTTLITIVGTVMYYLEGPQNGFTSIPKSIYWAVVTMTTVGYGDITPSTTLGQLLSAILMITGYGVIAVPTGILSSEMSKLERREPPCEVCEIKLNPSPNYCPHCGRALNST